MARVEELVSFRKEVNNLTKVIQTSQTQSSNKQMILDVGSKGLQFSAEQMILDQIRFDHIEDRLITIPNANEKTLRWLFHDGQAADGTQSSTFGTWLLSNRFDPGLRLIKRSSNYLVSRNTYQKRPMKTLMP